MGKTVADPYIGDPVAVSKTKDALITAFNNISSRGVRLEGLVEDVGAFWKGAAAAAYTDLHQRYNTDLKGILTALDDLGEKLGIAANQQIVVEDQNTGDVKGISTIDVSALN